MIYTCYFSGLGSGAIRDNAVSVCMQQPPGFNLPVAEDLAPPFGMLWKFMRGRMSQKRFVQLYNMRFGILDPEDVYRKYDGKILVAWEGYADRAHTALKFSHRHLISEWLNSNGFACEELPPAVKCR